MITSICKASDIVSLIKFLSAGNCDISPNLLYGADRNGVNI